MARPKKDPDALPTRERILAAGEASFAQIGYAEARLEDIARDVGIRRPSLLYHFGSKDALYEAVVERTFSKLNAALTGAVGVDGGFPEQLDAIVKGYLEFLDGEPHFAPLILRELIDGRGPGRDLILGQLIPTLDMLESVLSSASAGVARPDLPWRQTILLIATSPLVRAASGPLREPLWGADEHLPRLARSLILADG